MAGKREGHLCGACPADAYTQRRPCSFRACDEALGSGAILLLDIRKSAAFLVLLVPSVACLTLRLPIHQDVAQRIMHGPSQVRSRFSLGRLSRITTVLGSMIVGAGLGTVAAGEFGASAPDAALSATACATLFAANILGLVGRLGVERYDGCKGLVLSAADANALLLTASFVGLGVVGGRYTIGDKGGVHFLGCVCQGVHEDGFVNPLPSAIFGPIHEDKMSVAHMVAAVPFSIVDCILGCMGYMPASVRVAMTDPRVQASALRGGAHGALMAHSLGTLEARLLKANMDWAGTMELLSPPPPFGWEEGTVRTCGRFDPICSGPLMSVAKHMLAAPVNYQLRDISDVRSGMVHMRPFYTRHLAGADAL